MKKFLDYITLLDASLDRCKPDLVVFMGDQACGETVDELQKVLTNSLSPVLDRNIPYAVVLGNHDGESGVDRQEHRKVYRKMKNCLFQCDGSYKNDSGDYCINIHNIQGEPAFTLWFIDSGCGSKFENSYYSTVSDEQNEWFLSVENEIEQSAGKKIPSAVFQHIPVCEEYDLLEESGILSTFVDGVSGVNGTAGKYFRPKKDEKYQFEGYLGEAPATPDVNSGQFDVWKRNGNVKASFFGHDHMNDFTGFVDGILLAQCKTASFRVYGDGMNQGVRVVDISENGDIKTKMLTYRELLGSSCRSLRGRVKLFHDRLNVKIDFVEKYILPVAAVSGLGVVGYKIYKKYK